MAIEFCMTNDQQGPDSGVKILTFGKAGMGKTMLAATLPAPILISAESGLLSLKRANIERVYGVNTPGICYDIPTIKVSTFEDVVDAYNFVIGPNGANFQSVALDSLTEIAETCLTSAKKLVKDPRQAYGELIEKMTVMIRLFRDIPNKNVYMSAKMEPYKDEFTGAVRFGPMMPGAKLGPALGYYFDEMFHYSMVSDLAGNKSRVLQTESDLQYEAKDRSGALLAQEVPNLGIIINKINGVI